MRQRFSSIWRDERGNSFIEMALAAPLLTALLIGTVDISRSVSAKVQLEQVAQSTIERVQAQGNFKTSEIDDLEAYAEAQAGAGSNATITAWLECNHNATKLDYDTGSCTAGDPYARYVNVTVASTYSPMFGTKYFPGANADGIVAVSGTATVRTQ